MLLEIRLMTVDGLGATANAKSLISQSLRPLSLALPRLKIPRIAFKTDKNVRWLMQKIDQIRQSN